MRSLGLLGGAVPGRLHELWVHRGGFLCSGPLSLPGVLESLARRRVSWPLCLPPEGRLYSKPTRRPGHVLPRGVRRALSAR